MFCQELQKLKEREEEAEKKRHEAEAWAWAFSSSSRLDSSSPQEKAQELRELLDYADQAAEEAGGDRHKHVMSVPRCKLLAIVKAIRRKREELEKAHAEETSVI